MAAIAEGILKAVGVAGKPRLVMEDAHPDRSLPLQEGLQGVSRGCSKGSSAL